MVTIRNIWPSISTLEARGGDAAFGWIMCCSQQRSCKSGVTGRDVLSQGSSRMKQQNAAWPAHGRSHFPSVWPPPHPRGHPASEASGPVSPPRQRHSFHQHPPHAAAFVCSGEFGNAAVACSLVTRMAGQEGNAELSPQLHANPVLIPSATERSISQRCFGTNEQMACSEQQGLEVKPGSSLPEV